MNPSKQSSLLSTPTHLQGIKPANQFLNGCPTGIEVSDAARSRRDKKVARFYEHSASKQRISLYFVRWLGWVLIALGASSAFAGTTTCTVVTGIATLPGEDLPIVYSDCRLYDNDNSSDYYGLYRVPTMYFKNALPPGPGHVVVSESFLERWFDDLSGSRLLPIPDLADRHAFIWNMGNAYVGDCQDYGTGLSTGKFATATPGDYYCAIFNHGSDSGVTGIGGRWDGTTWDRVAGFQSGLPDPTSTPIPLLGGWGLLAMGGLVGLVGGFARRGHGGRRA